MKLSVNGVTYTVHFNRKFAGATVSCRVHTDACVLEKNEDGRQHRATPTTTAFAAIAPRRRRVVYVDRNGDVRTRYKRYTPPINRWIGRKIAFEKVLLKMLPRIDLDALTAIGTYRAAHKQNLAHRDLRTHLWQAYWRAIEPRDRCELCGGKRGGMRGLENFIVVEHKIVIACHACTSDRMPIDTRKAVFA